MPDPLRVLVVQDAAPDALGRAGFTVDTASTATDAVDLLATRRYAVVVADCALPDLPALDWLAALRGAWGTTPLVLCSGQVGRQDLPAYAVEFGAVAVLEKPFSGAGLVGTVRRVIP